MVEEDLANSEAGKDRELVEAANRLIELVRTQAPGAAAAIGVDLKDVEAANLRLRDIAASGTGVKGQKRPVQRRHRDQQRARRREAGRPGNGRVSDADGQYRGRASRRSRRERSISMASRSAPREEELVAALERRGLLAGAELAGLQRRTIITLAQRLKPAERLDFEQAVTELERAVEVALDVIARGERGTNDDAFVNAVLARVAERVRSDDLDGGAQAIDAALAEIEAGYRRSQTTLLEEGVKVDTLRRDAAAVARRIEMLVAVDHPTDRPAWLPEFRERYDAFLCGRRDAGHQFSLSVAIELARRMAGHGTR